VESVVRFVFVVVVDDDDVFGIRLVRLDNRRLLVGSTTAAVSSDSIGVSCLSKSTYESSPSFCSIGSSSSSRDVVDGSGIACLRLGGRGLPNPKSSIMDASSSSSSSSSPSTMALSSSPSLWCGVVV